MDLHFTFLFGIMRPLNYKFLSLVNEYPRSHPLKEIGSVLFRYDCFSSLNPPDNRFARSFSLIWPLTFGSGLKYNPHITGDFGSSSMRVKGRKLIVYY